TKMSRRSIYMSTITTVINCFFFQAEDGIRDRNVTGVQTCALPIYAWKEAAHFLKEAKEKHKAITNLYKQTIDDEEIKNKEKHIKIGRASCRERVKNYEVVREL